MKPGDGLDMYVFRASRREQSGRRLVDELIMALRSISDLVDPDHDRPALVTALLASGELECALADVGHDHARLMARVSDWLADALVGGNVRGDVRWALSLLRTVEAPDSLWISPPESFAYYALHPLDFADLVGEAPRPPERACVLGIRTIGSTLSAVVVAALRKRGAAADRSTVRPTGHPYNRTTHFDPIQSMWLRREREDGAHCYVVDEGPGLSGSSFLSVGEALANLGFERNRIHFFCTRAAEPSTLVARDAARRWSGFETSVVTAGRHVPKSAALPIGAGNWRARFYSNESFWPASWPSLERLKFLTADRKTLLKFEGLARYGRSVFARSAALADEGYGPSVREVGDGFYEYETIEGRPLGRDDLSTRLLVWMATYCAFRGDAFAVSSSAGGELERMLEVNLHHEIPEHDLSAPELEVVRPVVADARMMPHEWIGNRNGIVKKTDGASHGDDHLFPGPVDIAWDLAGVTVEWELGTASTRFFLDAYRRASGDDAEQRLQTYVFAYTLFRLAYCKLAARALGGTSEARRFMRDYARYKDRLDRLLGRGRSALGAVV